LTRGISFSTKFSREIPTDKYDKYRNLAHYNNKSYDYTEYKNTLENKYKYPTFKKIVLVAQINFMLIMQKIDKTIERVGNYLKAKKILLLIKLNDFYRISS
jgi:hypothetical protein